MKINLFILLYFVTTSLTFAQTRGPEGEVAVPPTPEENFYGGEQVNSDTFGAPSEDLEQEEVPFDAFEELSPYEDLDPQDEDEDVEEY